MKKFFALMLVVAMLSVAGSAMAATISADTTALTSTNRAVVSTDFTVSADHEGGTLSIDISTGTAAGWAKLTFSSKDAKAGSVDVVITFSPTVATKASNYTATVRAIETFISGDSTGHTIEHVTATKVFTVTVTGTDDPTKKEVTEETKVIDVAKSTKTTLSQITGIPSTLVNTFRTYVVTIRTSLKAIMPNVPDNAEVKDGSNVVSATTDNYKDGDDEGNLRRASLLLQKKSGTAAALKRALGTAAPFTAKEAGIQGVPGQVDTDFAGYDLGVDMGDDMSNVVNGFATADASGKSDVVFVNDSGAVITKVPTDGKVTAMAYVEPNKTYQPIFFVQLTAASADQFDKVAGTKSQDVTIVVPAEEKKTVSSDTVFPTGKKFTFNVGSSDRVALEKAAGVSLDRLPASTTSSDQTALTGFLDDGTYYYEEVALIPVLQNMAPNTGNHKYVVAFKYERQHGSLMTVAGAPVFNSNGASLTANGTLYAIDYSGTEAKASTAVAANTTDGNTGFLVFKVSGDAVATFSAANASFADPRVMARTTSEVSEGEPGASSSSGGCSAGSAALALAVLGSFILTRKK